MPAHEFPFDDPRDNPGYLLWQVSMRWQRAMTHALAPLGLTHTQFVLLAALRWLRLQAHRAEGNGPVEISKSDVARYANVDRMMTSKVLRALTARGLVTAETHGTNPRAQSLALTGAGVDTLARALATAAAVDDGYFGGVRPEAVAVLRALAGEG